MFVKNPREWQVEPTKGYAGQETSRFPIPGELASKKDQSSRNVLIVGASTFDATRVAALVQAVAQLGLTTRYCKIHLHSEITVGLGKTSVLILAVDGDTQAESSILELAKNAQVKIVLFRLCGEPAIQSHIAMLRDGNVDHLVISEIGTRVDPGMQTFLLS